MVKGSVKKLNSLSSMVGSQQIMPKNEKPISSNTNVLFRVICGEPIIRVENHCLWGRESEGGGTNTFCNKSGRIV